MVDAVRSIDQLFLIIQRYSRISDNDDIPFLFKFIQIYLNLQFILLLVSTFARASFLFPPNFLSSLLTKHDTFLLD